MTEPDWLSPEGLDEAIGLRVGLGEDGVVVAGGTFVGILVSTGLIRPRAFIHLGRVPGLDQIEIGTELRLGALVTHRQVERSAALRQSGWAAVADCFALVASPRVRNQATVGGVLCDADYASDPPTLLAALGARVRLRSAGGEREMLLSDFIEDHYQTRLGSDELLVEVIVPRPPARVSYLKFRSRSSEDRPCVGVAVAADLEDGGRCKDLQVVVGAVAGRPQRFPEVCAMAAGERLGRELIVEIAEGYAGLCHTISDVRGSAAYRSRVIAALVRRALAGVAA